MKRLGICRIPLNSLFKGVYCILISFKLNKSDSPEVVGLGIGWIDRDRLVKSTDRFLVAFPPGKRDTQIVVCRAIFRL